MAHAALVEILRRLGRLRREFRIALAEEEPRLLDEEPEVLGEVVRAAVRPSVEGEVRIGLAGEPVGRGKVRLKVLRSPSLEADGGAVVPPVGDKALLALLELMLLPELMSLGCHVILLRAEERVGVVEHFAVEGERPLREDLAVVRIARGARRLDERDAEPGAVMHRIEGLALDPLVRLALSLHVEVFVRHPFLIGPGILLEMVFIDVPREPLHEVARLLGGEGRLLDGEEERERVDEHDYLTRDRLLRSTSE